MKERPRNVDLSMLCCSCGDCHLHVTLLSDVGRQILVLLRSSASLMGFCWICVALLHVFLQFEWWISSFSTYGHRVFDTVQLTEGRPPGHTQTAILFCLFWFCFCFCFVSGHPVFCTFTCSPTARDQLTDECHELDRQSKKKSSWKAICFSLQIFRLFATHLSSWLLHKVT